MKSLLVQKWGQYGTPANVSERLKNEKFAQLYALRIFLSLLRSSDGAEGEKPDFRDYRLANTLFLQRIFKAFAVFWPADWHSSEAAVKA